MLFNPTNIPPNVTVRHFKRTKLIATVGPATNSYEMILAMLKGGANCFRLNFSHGTLKEREQQIKWIRRASKAYGKPAAILQDLAGPKIRFGELPEKVNLHKGDRVLLGYKADPKHGIFPTQYDLSTKVKKDERILFNDGQVEGVVEKVHKNIVTVKVVQPGWIASRKGINLPDTDLAGDILTDKDKADIRFGVEQGVDFVGLSFVQTPDDVERLRRYLKSLKSEARIISKIETKRAIEYIDAIVMVSDAVCIARGDLAVETTPEAIPVYQRHIIDLCRKYGKVSIVATQMLTSMMESTEPTRAEVSDVATATILGADCVWLSDETANGRYPIEAVEYMQRITRYAEEHLPVQPLYMNSGDMSVQSAISSGIITLAHQVGAVAIVAETESGITASSIASHRPQMPIIAMTSNLAIARQLCLRYGVKSFVRPVEEKAAHKLTDWLHKHKILKKGDVVIMAAGKYTGTPGSTDTIKVRRIE